MKTKNQITSSIIPGLLAAAFAITCLTATVQAKTPAHLHLTAASDTGKMDKMDKMKPSKMTKKKMAKPAKKKMDSGKMGKDTAGKM